MEIHAYSNQTLGIDDFVHLFGLFLDYFLELE